MSQILPLSQSWETRQRIKGVRAVVVVAVEFSDTLLIAGILMVYRFPITKEQHQETLAKLAQRKENRDG